MGKKYISHTPRKENENGKARARLYGKGKG